MSGSTSVLSVKWLHAGVPFNTFLCALYFLQIGCYIWRPLELQVWFPGETPHGWGEPFPRSTQGVHCHRYCDVSVEHWARGRSVREPPCQPLVVFQGHCSGHKLEKTPAYTEVWVYDTQVSQSDPAPRDDDHDWAPEQQAVTWREYQ